MLGFPSVAGHDAPPLLDRALALAAHVGSLTPYWLDTRCGCGATTLIPLRLLVEQGQRARTVADVVLRLRCSRCGLAPARVDLVEYAGEQGVVAYGGKPPWRIALASRAAD